MELLSMRLTDYYYYYAVSCIPLWLEKFKLIQYLVCKHAGNDEAKKIVNGMRVYVIPLEELM